MCDRRLRVGVPRAQAAVACVDDVEAAIFGRTRVCGDVDGGVRLGDSTRWLSLLSWDDPGWGGVALRSSERVRERMKNEVCMCWS